MGLAAVRSTPKMSGGSMGFPRYSLRGESRAPRGLSGAPCRAPALPTLAARARAHVRHTPAYGEGLLGGERRKTCPLLWDGDMGKTPQPLTKPCALHGDPKPATSTIPMPAGCPGMPPERFLPPGRSPLVLSMCHPSPPCLWDPLGARRATRTRHGEPRCRTGVLGGAARPGHGGSSAAGGPGEPSQARRGEAGSRRSPEAWACAGLGAFSAARTARTQGACPRSGARGGLPGHEAPPRTRGTQMLRGGHRDTAPWG